MAWCLCLVCVCTVVINCACFMWNMSHGVASVFNMCWLFMIVCFVARVSIMCWCVLFVIYCLMLNVVWCVFVCDSFNMSVRSVADVLCDAVWCVWLCVVSVVCECVCVW